MGILEHPPVFPQFLPYCVIPAHDNTEREDGHTFNGHKCRVDGHQGALARREGFADGEDKRGEIARDKEKGWDEVVVIWYAADGEREVVWCGEVLRKAHGARDGSEVNLDVLQWYPWCRYMIESGLRCSLFGVRR